MTKPKAQAKPKAAAKATPAKAPAVDRHAGHTTIDQVSWNEAKGEATAYRLCSCGAKRALEG